MTSDPTPGPDAPRAPRSGGEPTSAPAGAPAARVSLMAAETLQGAILIITTLPGGTVRPGGIADLLSASADRLYHLGAKLEPALHEKVVTSAAAALTFATAVRYGATDDAVPDGADLVESILTLPEATPRKALRALLSAAARVCERAPRI